MTDSRSLRQMTEGLIDGLCDDAAIFPPGNLPLAEAVTAHLAHRASPHRRVVGPFVIGAASVPKLAALLEDRPAASFDVAVTVPEPAAVGEALAAVELVPALVPVAVEVAVPLGMAADEVVPALDSALAGRPDMAVFVELPRDERRAELVAELSGTSYLAKLRTGGVEAHLYPDEAELAAAVIATARAGLPFKATAGLHHAVRNTDPDTGFEQHGFLNVIAAVDAAFAGAEQAEVAAVLADRDAARIAGRVRALGERTDRVREQFRSFGTCSIDDPVVELNALGLGPADTLTEGVN